MSWGFSLSRKQRLQRSRLAFVVTKLMLDSTFRLNLVEGESNYWKSIPCWRRAAPGLLVATGDKFDGATLIDLSACKETVQLIISSENLVSFGRSIAATRFVTLILLSEPIPCRTASDSRQSYHSVISRRGPARPGLLSFSGKWRSCWIGSLPVDTEDCRISFFRLNFRLCGVKNSEKVNFFRFDSSSLSGSR